MMNSNKQLIKQQINMAINKPNNRLLLQQASQKLKKLLIKKQALKQNYPIQVIDHLWIGNYAYSSNQLFLHDNNIKLVISCLDAAPSKKYHNIQYKIIPVKDQQWSQIQNYFQSSYQWIESAFQKQHSIYIHCFSGKSRSATILIAYLMKKLGISYDDSQKILLQKHLQAQPNAGFIQKLKLYQRKVKEDQKKTKQNEILIDMITDPQYQAINKNKKHDNLIDLNEQPQAQQTLKKHDQNKKEKQLNNNVDLLNENILINNQSGKKQLNLLQQIVVDKQIKNSEQLIHLNIQNEIHGGNNENDLIKEQKLQQQSQNKLQLKQQSKQQKTQENLTSNNATQILNEDIIRKSSQQCEDYNIQIQNKDKVENNISQQGQNKHKKKKNKKRKR